MPKSPWTGAPRPTPKTVRPLASRSRVTVCRASTHGRRLDTGVIIGPIMMRSVRTAMADSTAHGSTIDGPRPSFDHVMWSQMKKPSNPDCSASTARSTKAMGSSPKQGAATPRLMLTRLFSIGLCQRLQLLQRAGRGQGELAGGGVRRGLASQHRVDVPDGGGERPLVRAGALDDGIGVRPEDGEGVGRARVEGVGQVDLPLRPENAGESVRASLEAARQQEPLGGSEADDAGRVDLHLPL